MGGRVTCFRELVWGKWRDCEGTGQDLSGAMGRVKGLQQGGSVCRGLGGCGRVELWLLSFPLQGPKGWGCTGAATRPQAQPSENHMPIPAWPWSAPALPGLQGQCWECRWDPPRQRCGAAVHIWLPGTPFPSARCQLGDTIQIFPPQGKAAASPCTGNTIPVNFPADFPASPSPACVITVPGSCFPL